MAIPSALRIRLSITIQEEHLSALITLVYQMGAHYPNQAEPHSIEICCQICDMLGSCIRTPTEQNAVVSTNVSTMPSEPRMVGALEAISSLFVWKNPTLQEKTLWAIASLVRSNGVAASRVQLMLHPCSSI